MEDSAFMPLASRLLALVAASLLCLGSAAAQPATPRPSVETCAVPRREIPAIVAILASRPATPAATRDHAHETPTATALPPIEPIGTPRLLRPELPAGNPVADDVVAGLTETVQRYLACANGADVIGLMSLVSDEFLRQSFGAGILTEADLRAYAAAARPVPLAQRRRLVAIREGRRLRDGRVAVLVDTAPLPSTRPAAVDTDLVTFVEADGRYLIDEYLAGVTLWLGPEVTPEP